MNIQNLFRSLLGIIFFILLASLVIPFIKKYFLCCFLVWSTFISYYLINLVYKELNFVRFLNTENIPEKFHPWIRKDFDKWDIIEIILVGIFILPLRFSLVIFSTVLTYTLFALIDN